MRGVTHASQIARRSFRMVAHHIKGLRGADSTSDKGTTQRILVSYGTAEWYTSLLRLEASARRFGFTVVRTWRRSDLVSTPFYDRHQPILDQPRGGGYWLWKPYYILRALEEAEPGDAVVYMDAGAALTGDISPLIDRCRVEGGVLLFAGHYEGDGLPGPNTNGRWTKRDCFVRMGADEPRFHLACQADASLLVFIQNERSLDFAREFLRYCEDPAILTDVPNTSGLPDLDGFLDHRHDQSVLSVLAVRHDLPLHRHPSQHGNHLKEPAQRQKAEWCRLPYSDSPWPDRYGTLLDHHRARSDRQLLIQARDVLGDLERNRAVLREIPSWISDEVYERSVFNYGLPDRVRPLIDREVGDEPTYTDLLVHAARHLQPRVAYLEVGVSVGKNFYQLLRALTSSRLVGFDFEDINPVLRQRLGQKVERLGSWPTPTGSLREAPSSMDRYSMVPGDNLVDYICADIWDESAWARLAGSRFNVVFSDGAHSPDALRHEARMLERHDLLDSGGFIMVWDDLGGAMTDAFIEIWERLRGRFDLPDESLRLGLVRGWLGVHEPPHLVGIVVTDTRLLE